MQAKKFAEIAQSLMGCVKKNENETKNALAGWMQSRFRVLGGAMVHNTIQIAKTNLPTEEVEERSKQLIVQQIAKGLYEGGLIHFWKMEMPNGDFEIRGELVTFVEPQKLELVKT